MDWCAELTPSVSTGENYLYLCTQKKEEVGNKGDYGRKINVSWELIKKISPPVCGSNLLPST